MSKKTDPRVARSRAAVLDAAAALLAEGGLAAVTIDGIVGRSGVAKTTVYRHWTSRADVLVDLFATLVPQAPQPGPPSTTPFEVQLRQLVHELGRQIDAGPWSTALPALFEAAERDPALAGVRQRVKSEAEAPLVALLAQAPPQYGRIDPSEAISQLIGPLLHRRLLEHRPIDQAFTDRHVDLFLASRSSPPQASLGGSERA